MRKKDNKEVPFEKLGLSNDYIFSKAMQNPKLCKKLLEVILGIKIKKIEYPEAQKTIDEKIDAKSIRLDVYVDDGKKTVYNIEMQTTNKGNLPKRSRYYQSMIDLHLIEKGEEYSKLKKSYVIFICMTDIFKKGRHLYTFENKCVQDPELSLGDETIKVFLNPEGTIDDIGTDLKNFLKYLVDGTISDDFTEELSKEVDAVRNNEEWRREYMTLQMIRSEERAEGRAEEKKANLKKFAQYLLDNGFASTKKEAMEKAKSAIS